MQFFSRVFGAASKTSRVRRADRSPRSRCAQIGVESLEARDLKSDIAGVSNQAGVLVITATQAANNTAIVSNDQNGKVEVTLNGNREVFPAGFSGLSLTLVGREEGTSSRTTPASARWP